MNQLRALKILQSGQNVFLTGSAGTGKTFLLNKFIAYLKSKKIKTAVTASTGIAATHLSGITIHSWSGIGIERSLDKKQIKKLLKKRRWRERIRKTQTLIIDEISMLEAARLDLVDQVCRAVRNPFLPFGGLQLVVCGDFFQLPPVNKTNERLSFAYDAQAWPKANLRVCYLDKSYRQEDAEFLEILNKIRRNEAGFEEWQKLNARLLKPVSCSIKPTKLYTHNLDVDAINNQELSLLKTKEKIYPMTSNGSKKLIDFLKKSCLAPQELKLKIGAAVMFVKNNFEAGYVNGTLGKIIGFEENYPVVKARSGDEIVAAPAVWNIEEDDLIIASIRQIPLRLAWAITVHKSQGMNLDAAEIDLSKSFECGMGYVALSRVRRLDGIKLMGINQMALRVSPEVVKKDKEFLEFSRTLEIGSWQNF